jgi:hypothetical protein
MRKANVRKPSRLWIALWLLWSITATAEFRPQAAGSEKTATPPRTVYQVKPEDYQADVPAQPPARMLSQTETEIRWRVEWQSEKTGRGVRLQLAAIRVYATIQTGKSWNSAPNDPRLLMHGQGHLELSEIFAREFELRLREAIHKGSPLTASGSTLGEAESAMHRRLLEKLHEDRYLLEERHREYDKATDHGRSRTTLEQRQATHAERLKELAEKLDPLPKAP